MKTHISPLLSWGLVVVLMAAFIGFFVNFELSILFLLFVLMAVWTFMFPTLGLFSLVVMAPLLPVIKATQTIEDITLIKDVVILTLFWKFFLWPLLLQRLPYRRNIFFAPLLLLAAWTGFAMLRADSHALGILRVTDLA